MTLPPVGQVRPAGAAEADHHPAGGAHRRRPLLRPRLRRPHEEQPRAPLERGRLLEQAALLPAGPEGGPGGREEQGGGGVGAGRAPAVLGSQRPRQLRLERLALRQRPVKQPGKRSPSISLSSLNIFFP